MLKCSHCFSIYLIHAMFLFLFFLFTLGERLKISSQFGQIQGWVGFSSTEILFSSSIPSRLQNYFCFFYFVFCFLFLCFRRFLAYVFSFFFNLAILHFRERLHFVTFLFYLFICSLFLLSLFFSSDTSFFLYFNWFSLFYCFSSIKLFLSFFLFFHSSFLPFSSYLNFLTVSYLIFLVFLFLRNLC